MWHGSCAPPGMDEDQALWLLRNADQAEPREPLRGMAMQLLLWQTSRRGVRTTWSIFQAARQHRAVVREARYEPSRPVRIRDADLAWETLAPFLEVAGGLGADPAKNATAGLEGTRSYAHVRVEWKGRGRPWFERFRKLLLRALDEVEE